MDCRGSLGSASRAVAVPHPPEARMFASSLRTVCWSVLLVVLPELVRAQGGAISGRVTDKLSGTAVVAATVEVSVPPARGRTALTDAEGRYRISDLAPGRYTVEV